MNARGEFSLFHIVWLINLKYNNNWYYADNHLIGTSKDSILDGNKDNINIHFPGPQVLGWAACKCPLYCPGPLQHTDLFCIVHWTQLYILTDRMGPLTPGLFLSATPTSQVMTAWLKQTCITCDDCMTPTDLHNKWWLHDSNRPRSFLASSPFPRIQSKIHIRKGRIQSFLPYSPAPQMNHLSIRCGITPNDALAAQRT